MAQSNVGRQRVVECWSSNRERSSSELSTDARDGQQRSAGGRAHRSGQHRDGQHVVEVWRRERRQQLVGQHRGLVREAVLHRQPVPQPLQRRCVCWTVNTNKRHAYMRTCIEFEVAALVHEALYRHASSYPADDACPRRLRSADTRTLPFSRTRTNFRDRAFSAAGPRV